MAAGRLLPVLLLLLGVPGGSGGDPPSGPAALAARCRLPALTGRCRASIPRWFFNASAGSCQSFVFGGCGGNGNNFGSERECRESCAPSSPAPTNSTSSDDLGAEFRRFFTSKGAVFGGLLALGAALGSVLSLVLRRCRRTPRAPPSPEDRECLMKDPYPA